MSFNEPIFTPEEINENEQKKAALNKLLLSGDGILMLGSGCSATIYPTWDELMKLLSEDCCRKDKKFLSASQSGEDPLVFVDKVKKFLGDNHYYNLIFRIFKEKQKTHEKYHEALCNLLNKNKIKGITTTNYDLVLENALVSVRGKSTQPIYIDSDIEQARIFEFFLSLNNGDVPIGIFHIHGVHDKKGSIILSRSEYEEKYGFKVKRLPEDIYNSVKHGKMSEVEFADLLNDYGMKWTLHYKILWSLFATRRLIFLGFSFNDPYFNKMLEFVSKDLHTNGYEQHFLILRISKQEEKENAKTRATELKESYGIETIFFEDNENKKGLENFIFEMEKTVNNQDVPAKEDKIMPPEGDFGGNEELTKNLIQQFKGKT